MSGNTRPHGIPGKDAPSPGERFPLAAKALRVSTAQASQRHDDVQPSTPRAATTQAARSKANNWPLYLMLVLLPLQNIQYGYIPNIGGGLNFLNVMPALSLLGALILKGKLAPRDPIRKWLVAYVLYTIVSLLIGNLVVGLAAERFIILKDHLVGILLYFLVQMSVRNWSHVRRIFICTLIPLPYIARVTINQHLSVSSWHYSDDLRITGTFSQLGANEFAAFCVTVSIVLLAVLLATRLNRWWKIALIGGIVCMLIGILYSYSRTAYIALLLGILTVILVWRGRWKLIPLVVAIALLAPAWLPPSVVERFDSTTVAEGQRDESTELRIVYWGVAWDIFKGHPLTGTGFQTFKILNPYGKDTHNLYMRTLAEGGILGAIMLVGLLLSLLATARKTVSRSPSGTWVYGLSLGMLGATLALICSNLFGDRFTYYPVAAYFWTYAALMVKSPLLPPEEGGT
ncbi:MAG: O-antigen ligase family protein [Pseudoxanthomonas sp.]